jgi:hypothetical protein
MTAAFMTNLLSSVVGVFFWRDQASGGGEPRIGLTLPIIPAPIYIDRALDA